MIGGDGMTDNLGAGFIGPGVVIMTAYDFQQRLDAMYRRGVERGRFEERSDARKEPSNAE